VNTADRILALKLVTDVGDINKQMKGATSGFRKMGGAAKSWAKAMGGAFVLSGLEAIPSLVGDAFAGFRAGEDAARNLGITWKNLGLDAKDLGGALDDISGLALDLGFDDAEITGVFDTLLGKTGDVNKAFAGTNQVMDLVRGKGWSLQKALKYVTTHLGDVDTALETNKGKARAWARAHPLEVTAGRIAEDFENIIGALSGGDFEGAMANLRSFAGHVEDLLFGTKQRVDLGSGMEFDVRRGGLLARLGEVGGKLVDGIIAGLAGLGPRVLEFWDTEIAGQDWGAAITTALTNVWTAITADPKKAGDVGAAAGAIGLVFAGAMLTVTLLSNALGAVMRAPEFLVGQGVKGAGNAIGLIFRGAMFAVDMMSRGLISLIGQLRKSETIGALATGFGNSLGGKIAKGILAGLIFADVLNAFLDSIGWPSGDDAMPHPPVWDPVLKKFVRRESGGPAGGWTLVGEGGPELLNLPGGSHVYSNADSRAMMGGGGGNITVNIQAGVGDPYAIGREVDRVLRVYRKRAGLPIAGAMT
jgi:hypothetical protein